MQIKLSHIRDWLLIVAFVGAAWWASNAMKGECITIKGIESLHDFDSLLYDTDRGFVLRVYYCEHDPMYWYATKDGEPTSRLADACAEAEMEEYRIDWKAGIR